MADVSAGRGQIMLVTALAVAALLVGLAVVLNAAAHTEEVAARESAVGEREALEFRRDAAAATARLVRHVTRAAGANDSYAALRDDLAARLATWSDLAGRHAAVAASSRYASLAATTNGTRLVHANRSRTFTSADGDTAWTLVGNATAVRNVTFDVDARSLVVADPEDGAAELADAGAFAVALDDGDATRVFVSRNGSGGVLVSVANASGDVVGTCRADPGADGTVPVDVSNRSVGGAACPALDVVPDGEFAVRFERGGNASGTYSLVVDVPLSAVDDGDVVANGTAGDAPVATRALYAARVAVVHETPAFRFEGVVRVAPGESGG